MLGYKSGAVTIRADEGENAAGFGELADPWRVASDWEERGRFRDYRQAFRARCYTYMAGAEAESELLGHCAGGDGDDRDQIAVTLQTRHVDVSEPNLDAFDDRARRQVRRLVRKHRAAIERVAAALLERETLLPQEVESLMR